MAQLDPDPYLVLLRRELTRAQARLRRCERERDALRAALDTLNDKTQPDAQEEISRFQIIINNI